MSDRTDPILEPSPKGSRPPNSPDDELNRRKFEPIGSSVIAPLRRRWSPRAFADRPVADAALRSLFEAARWAASSFNQQPWRFVVATRDDSDAFEAALACLRPKNASWAKRAPVLVFTVIERTWPDGDDENPSAEHDLGLAVGNLSAQATALGLSLHQMRGIDREAVRETYDVPAGFDPFTAIAIGYRGEPELLADDLRERERAERSRRPLAETVFRGRFGAPEPRVTEPAETEPAEPDAD